VKHCLLLTISIILSIPPAFTHLIGGSSVGALLGKSKYEQLFPHHHVIYSYKNFLIAAKMFPLFAQEGNPIIRQRELTAFFAHIAHETTTGWAGAKNGPYVWGLYYTEEQACKDGHCTQYNTAGSSGFQPVTGKSYYGRGPIQLSYAYNYGLAGKDLGVALLEQPELVSTNGVIAFKTALWFWMRSQIPKPSCHDVMCGKWHPSATDSILLRKPGFGMTINIINGGVECNSTNPSQIAEREERIGFYEWFAKIMNIKPGSDCDCKGMGSY
jgi:basic endochitinase B